MQHAPDAQRRSPLVTVLMRVYNSADHVAEAIESILAQTFSNFELLIVEGASTDSSAAAVRAFSDERIRIVTQVGRGKNDALMCGLSSARGTYVAIQDADDRSHPDRLERQVSLLESNPQTVIVGSSVTIIDRDGRAIGHRAYPAEDRKIRSAMPLYNPFAHSAVMFRLESARACGGYTDTQVLEDYDFYPRLLRLGDARNIENPLADYRLHTYAAATHVKYVLRATIAAKWKMHRAYGYRWSIASALVLTAQTVMLYLPSGFVNWLFRAVFIRPNAGRITAA